jgi:hypothetical protein
MLVEQLAAHEMTRCARQHVVAEIGIVIEAEVVERVGHVQPELVWRSCPHEH